MFRKSEVKEMSETTGQCVLVCLQDQVGDYLDEGQALQGNLCLASAEDHEMVVADIGTILA